jgi:antitoxin YefM
VEKGRDQGYLYRGDSAEQYGNFKAGKRKGDATDIRQAGNRFINVVIFENVHIFVQNNVQEFNKAMFTTTISDFRKDIKQYLDRVTDNFETLIINRGKDQGVVIMSLDEYNSLRATHHELSSKVNEDRLDSAIEKLKSGKSIQKDLLEP